MKAKKGGLPMKRILCCLVVIAMLVPAICYAESNDEFEYRNGIKFGMTLEEVKSAELPLVGEYEDGYLTFSGQTVAGYDASVNYEFNVENNALNQIGIFFDVAHSNGNYYINDFDKIDDVLAGLYKVGKYTNLYNWDNDLYKDDTSHYGFAISAGHLSIVSN
jgi:hypothetical protein